MTARKDNPRIKIREPGAFSMQVAEVMEKLHLSHHGDLCKERPVFLDEKYEYLGCEQIIEANTNQMATADVKEQLKRIQGCSGALLDAMRSARGSTIDFLNARRPVERDKYNYCLPTLGQLQRSLEWLNNSAIWDPNVVETKNDTGPDRVVTARTVAEQAADDYYKITGKAPTTTTYEENTTKHKNFVWFLREIYIALDMGHNSVTARSREAVKKWKSDRQASITYPV